MISNLTPAFPASSGTYILVFSLFRPHVNAPGTPAQKTFSPGTYLYFGSAFGPGGLRGRLTRHLSGDKKKHWHIDSLLPPGVVQSVFYSTFPERLECTWVQCFQSQTGFSAPEAGFGASDCRRKCSAHLLQAQPQTDLNNWFDLLRSCLPGKELSCWVKSL